MKVFFVRHGQTYANIEHRNYKDYTESITDQGKKQATLAGKYLTTFGNFDLVISSPAIRCIQTAEIICKEINYTKKIVTSELILEKLKKSKIDEHNIKNQLHNENDELKKIIKEYFETTSIKDGSSYIKNASVFDETKDVFKQMELFYNYQNIFYKLEKKDKRLEGIDNFITLTNNHQKFLNQLKKLNKKCILVVGHSGTINYMTQIITNIFINPTNPTISIIPTEYIEKHIPINGFYKNSIDDDNTSIMGCLIKKSKVTLVIAPNTLHLKI
jgi:broad specificity phosphatase PhoE